MFAPRSVAVVGASNDPNKVGGRPLVFLRRAGYRGAVYPVNPGTSEVQGMRAYPSLAEVPGPVDHAILALSPRHTPAAMASCAAKRVQAVQVFTAGFAETGAAGRKLQEDLLRTARDAGIRVIGPNSLGLFNVHERFFGTFATVLDGAWPAAGNVSLVSQSGGFGSLCYLFARARGLGFSHFVTTGNEGDLDIAQCITYLAGEDSTRVIVACLEGCRDGRRLAAAIEMARGNGKPVIVMKLGATAAGARAVQSHTGALAGADAVFDAALRQAGAYRAHTLEALADCAYAASRSPAPAGRRLGIVTFSGGVGVLAADAAARAGLELPAPAAQAAARIGALLPTATPGNPLDTSAALVNDLSLYSRVLEVFLEETPCDIVFGYLAGVGLNPEHYERLRGPLFDVRRRHPGKLFLLTLACGDEVRADLERHDFLWFDNPQRALTAAAALVRLGEPLAPRRVPVAAPARIEIPTGPLDELQSQAILERAGVRFAPGRLVRSPQEAADAGRELGFPVALKIVSADIPHKSDVGGVRLDMRSETETAGAFLSIMEAVAARAPGARLAGVLVAPMVKGEETVLGVTRDPVFGPVVMFGTGGVRAELLNDVAFRLAPIDAAEARGMIEETRAGHALKGIRGAPGADVAAVARTLEQLSAFAFSHADLIDSIDINPFVVGPAGGCAVDALVVPAGSRHRNEETQT